MSGFPSGSISIAATFTAEPLSPSLSLILAHIGLPMDVEFAPYNQLLQQLLNDTGELARKANGINVLLIRIEDFVRDITDAALVRVTIAQVARELTTSLNVFASHARVPTIVSILPPPAANRLFDSDLISFTAKLTSHVQSLPGFVLLSDEEIDLVSTGPRFDPISDDLAHMPYTKDHYASLGLAIARKVHAIMVPAYKVLVLDCDNTLWQGVVGEDGVEGIAITPAFAQLQKFALNAHLRGALVCLVSKNTERDVLEVFERRPEMVLKLDHIVAHRINWESKPQNIRSLARSLNLGLESFVFLDDSPIECALMTNELPQVVTLQIPADEQMRSFLANIWAFDKVSVTDEDVRRTKMYKDNFARQELEDTSKDISEFISSLNVVIDIESPAQGEWTRLSQLTQRTNQFNFSTKRRNEPELRALQNRNFTVLRVNVRDRFGDYGMVGMVIAESRPDQLFVDTFLLSCRVLGRGVEHTILRKLGDLAISLSLSSVTIPFVPTQKNEPARAFIESVAAQFRKDDVDQIVFSIPSDTAKSITHRPGHDPVEVINASKLVDRESRSKSQTVEAGSRTERYSNLALNYISGSAILAAVHNSLARERSLESTAAPATSEVEHKMLRLWEDVLAMHGLGVDDDYFAIGGTSLVAAQLFAEIVRQFGVKLPLTAILTSPTIRELSLQIGEANTGGGLLELRQGNRRKLFLVHDGDGEILLYANLAKRLPDGTAVFGINPSVIPNVPLAHTSIGDMAASYIAMVRQKQRRGPYFLGGMCAGGVIAYEMAVQLIKQGETVELVALLDAATPQAARRAGRTTKHRLRRLSQLFTERGSEKDPLAQKIQQIIREAIQKASNTVRWELTSRFTRWSVRLRFRLLQRLLKRQSVWPPKIPGLSVRQIYESAEALYKPATVDGPKIVLFRATQGEGGDTPYSEIYSDPTFGWGGVARGIVPVNVEGGHFSMLQEPAVDHLADVFANILVTETNVHRTHSKIDEPA
jgi:FkbH-like protein